MVLVLCINVIIINLPNTEKSNLSIIYILFLFYFFGGGGEGGCGGWTFLESPDNYSGPEGLFYVCRVCSQDQSFNNFENNTMKLTVNEGKLTGL